MTAQEGSSISRTELRICWLSPSSFHIWKCIQSCSHSLLQPQAHDTDLWRVVCLLQCPVPLVCDCDRKTCASFMPALCWYSHSETMLNEPERAILEVTLQRLIKNFFAIVNYTHNFTSTRLKPDQLWGKFYCPWLDRQACLSSTVFNYEWLSHGKLQMVARMLVQPQTYQ